MPTNLPSRQSLVGLSSTNGFPTIFPEDVRPFSVSVAVSGSSATWNIEISNDFTGSSAFISSNAVWFSSLASALVSTGFVNVGVPCTAIRLNVTAGSSQAVTAVSFVQGG
jgi:hypothetical protein